MPKTADHQHAKLERPIAPPVSGCCNAKTRQGTPCKIKTIYRNGRCKLHGGLSTGPKTKKGKAASRRNGKKGGRPKQNRQEPQ